MPTTAYRIPVEQHFAYQQPVLAIQNDPPASPPKGARYIVGTSPTGDWLTPVNQAKKIAVCTVGGATPTWEYNTASEGWECTNLTDHLIYKYNNLGSWVADDLSSKMNLVPSATEDHLASYNASGQVKDSGLLTSNVSSAVSYANTFNGLNVNYDSAFNAIMMTL